MSMMFYSWRLRAFKNWEEAAEHKQEPLEEMYPIWTRWQPQEEMYGAGGERKKAPLCLAGITSTWTG